MNQDRGTQHGAGQVEDPTEVGAPRSPADRRVRLLNLVAVIGPMVAFGAAIWLAWGHSFNWTQAGILTAMCVVTAAGITIGYHRLFTHRSFETVAPVRWLLAALGSMAVQGPVIEWAGDHRRHHQHSDDEHDPHSPHTHGGEGFWGGLRGFVHAHIGWLFSGHSKGLGRYTRDLRSDPLLCAVNRQFPIWVIVGLALPALIAGLIEMSWHGALLGFLWGGLVRVMVVHHVTWSVNSVCHLWGTRPFRTGDHSRNNALLGMLALGEGWHNNHHAFPTSARHGLSWWQFDTSYLVIRTLEKLGLAWKVRVPTHDRVQAKRKVAPLPASPPALGPPSR